MPATATTRRAATVHRLRRLARRQIAILRSALARGDPRRWRVPAGADRLALALLTLALLLRAALVVAGWPATDSDEGITGIQALHIVERGEHPIFYYGIRYMGVLEAYLAAGAFRVFGSSLFTLRLGTLLLTVLALGAIYLLARRLYSSSLALFALALLAFGPAEALLRELWSGGGYAETLCFGALVMLLGVWLAETSTRASEAARSPTQTLLRLAAFAGWGLAAGLGIWSDTLVFPFVGASGLLLVVFCRHEWRTATPCLLAGLLLGAFPLFAYAFSAPDHNPFAGALEVTRSSNAWSAGVPTLLAGQLAGTLLVALPTITGGSSVCALARGDSWPLAHATPQTLLCTGIHGIWGIGYVVLLVAALISSVRALRVLPQSGERMVSEFARLALLTSAALTLLLFMASPVAARLPNLTSRYLIGLLIALPAVLTPVWRMAATHTTFHRSLGGWIGLQAASRVPRPFMAERVMRATQYPLASLIGVSWRAWAGRLALAVIALAYMIELFGVLQAVPATHAEGQRRAALAAHLEQSGVTRIYSEYWTCGWLIFLSREQVICAALDPQLRPDLDRYPPYREMVRAAPAPAYVFPLDSAQAAAFATRPQGAPSGAGYTREVYAGYVIYRPLPPG